MSYSDSVSEKNFSLHHYVIYASRHPILIHCNPRELNRRQRRNPVLGFLYMSRRDPAIYRMQKIRGARYQAADSVFSFHFEQYRGRHDSHVAHLTRRFASEKMEIKFHRKTDVFCFPFKS